MTSIHVNRVPLRAVSSGRCACFAVKGVSSLSLASCTDCSNKSLTDASAENSDYPLEIINLAALKSNLNVLENSSFNSNGSKIGSKLREELRICHDNDPRRRKLRVDDPEHPSNQIIRPGAALTVKPSTRKKSSPPGTSTGGVDYVSDFIKDSPLSWTFRPGMVLLSPMSHPVACIEFFANILVLNHPKWCDHANLSSLFTP